MKKQLTVSDYASGRIGKILEDCKKEDVTVTAVANNLKFLREELSLVNDAFPAEISSKKESKFIKQVTQEFQDEVAKDFIEMEPEMRYKQELSPEEAFQAFQEYIVTTLARKTAMKVLHEHYLPMFKMRYEAIFSKNSFKDFKRLYERNKE